MKPKTLSGTCSTDLWHSISFVTINFMKQKRHTVVRFSWSSQRDNGSATMNKWYLLAMARSFRSFNSIIHIKPPSTSSCRLTVAWRRSPLRRIGNYTNIVIYYVILLFRYYDLFLRLPTYYIYNTIFSIVFSIY